MSSLTAEKSLSLAQKAVTARNQVRAPSQLRNVACVLVIAAAVALASLLLIAFQVVNTADSVKAAASIACLAVLLVVASTYSIAAIFWNVYWRERSRRIEGESDLQELEARLPQILEASFLKAVEDEQSSSTPPLFVGIAPDCFREFAKRRLTRVLVAQVQKEIAIKEDSETLQHP